MSYSGSYCGGPAEERASGMSVIHLHLDFETRSLLDIREVGLDRYARNAEVLMMAWAVNDQPPQIWLPSEGPMPNVVEMSLTRGSGVKIAWNAAFERAILTHCLGIVSPIEQWIDPSAIAKYAGLPGRLGEVSEFMQLGDKGKDKEGKRLIAKFSKPHKTKKLGVHFKDPAAPENAEDWLKFQEYCRQDVVAEREIFHRLVGFFNLPPLERKIFELDAKINERGMPVNMTFVENASNIVETEMSKLRGELKALTGLENPNSVQQLIPWLRERGYPYTSLDKSKVRKVLEAQ
jgi:DNA polymerase